jgi:pimeloyl-ACP methyl ester carboxylesterase
VPGQPLAIVEGLVPVNGYRLYWKSVGPANARDTVLALHGGPGATHDYLLALNDLTESGYRVVYYDQIGCGRSDLGRTRSAHHAGGYG